MDGQSQRTSSGKGLRPLELGGGGGATCWPTRVGAGAGLCKEGPRDGFHPAPVLMEPAPRRVLLSIETLSARNMSSVTRAPAQVTVSHARCEASCHSV